MTLTEMGIAILYYKEESAKLFAKLYGLPVKFPYTSEAEKKLDEEKKKLIDNSIEAMEAFYHNEIKKISADMIREGKQLLPKKDNPLFLLINSLDNDNSNE